jgi:DNA-binding NarL/FixJ family response regulator
MPNWSRLRILIADDHDLMRRGIKTFLESHAGWKICGEAKTGYQAVALTKELAPDIVILDISMPDLNGIEAARKIRKESKDTEVLVMSVHYSDQLIRELFNAGVLGYILKSDPEEDLLVAVETLAMQKPFFTHRVRAVIRNEGVTQILLPLHTRLTPREREILQLLAEGKSCKQAALYLGISFKTADTHRSNMMNKLDMHNISELVRYAVRSQITEA